MLNILSRVKSHQEKRKQVLRCQSCGRPDYAKKLRFDKTQDELRCGDKWGCIARLMAWVESEEYQTAAREGRPLDDSPEAIWKIVSAREKRALAILNNEKMKQRPSLEES
jgi:hypothetical protein